MFLYSFVSLIYLLLLMIYDFNLISLFSYYIQPMCQGDIFQSKNLVTVPSDAIIVEPMGVEPTTS